MPGARNSAKDVAELRAAKRKSREVAAHIEAAGIDEDEEVDEETAKSVGCAVKVLAQDAATVTVGGYAIFFGAKDLVGDTFTTETDLALSRMQTIPVYFDHALGEPDGEIGTVKSYRVDENGLWVEAQLDKHKAYVAQVLELVASGVLGYSTGSVAHLVRRDGGTLKSWPVYELSLTTTPAEPRTVGVVQIKTGSLGENMNTQNITASDPNTGESVENSHSVPMAAGAGTPPPAPAPPTPDPRVGELEAAVNALEKQVRDVVSAPAVKGGVASGGADTDNAAIKAFNVFLRTGDTSGLKAAMQEGDDAQGGYLVPQQYSNDVVAALSYDSILRRAGARVIQVRGTDAFNVPTVTHSARAVIQSAEGVAADQKEPTIGQITFHPVTFTQLSKASMQLVQDSRIDIMSQILQPDFTQAFAAGENYWFVNGVGTPTTEPQGILSGASYSGVTTDSATAITSDNIIDAYYSLKDLYRNRAVWLMHDSTVKAVRKLKDLNDQYLWQPGLQSGEAATLMGRPVYTLPDMPELGTMNNKVIIFGDMSYFWIADFLLGQMGIEVLDQLYKANLQIGYLGYRRIDSRVMLSEAIKYVAAGS